MTFSRPSRSDNHLSNYWNALVHNAPAEELARLARLVEPSEIAAIEQVQAAHQRYEPDPVFARRLEQTLMDTATTATISPIAGTIPQPRVSPPSRNGSRIPFPSPVVDPLPHPHAPPGHCAGVPDRAGHPARPRLGRWNLDDEHRPDEPHRLLAPVVATPSPDASPDVPMYRANPERTGVMPGPGIDGEPVELWRAEFAGSIDSAASIVNGITYISVTNGFLYALDADTGETLWEYPSGSRTTSTVAVAAGVVYGGSGDAALFALNADDGSELWTVPDIQPSGALMVVEDVLYAGAADGNLYAIDLDGNVLWQASVGDTALRSPALAGDMVYAGNESGALRAFNRATGEPVWSFQTEGGGFAPTPMIANGVIYQTTSDGPENYIYAIDALSGEQRWRYEEPGNPGWLAGGTDGERLYIPSANGYLYALDAITSELVWRQQFGDLANAAPAIVDDLVYFAGQDGFVRALEKTTGEEQWRFPIDGPASYGPVVVDAGVYVGTEFGYMYAIGGSGEAATPVASPPVTLEGSPSATPVAATDVAVKPLWQSSGGPEPLLVPTGMAIAPDGTIWVVDSGNNRFQLFSPEGEYLETWGTPGDGEGEFNFSPNPDNPNDSVGGITFDSEGNFYVGDSANQRIQKFDADRTFVLSWGIEGEGEGQFLLPYWPVVAPDGNVYVGDGIRTDVQVFSPEGEFLYQLTGPGIEDHQLSSIGSLGIADDGTVHVTDTAARTIKVFAADGTYIDSWGSFGVDEGEFRGPTSVAIDAVGNVYVADLDNGRVQVFNPDREFLALWSHADAAGNPFAAPLVVAIDDAGGVYVTDPGLGTLQKFEVTLPGTPDATPVN